jgi:hypothetical protein
LGKYAEEKLMALLSDELLKATYRSYDTARWIDRLANFTTLLTKLDISKLNRKSTPQDFAQEIVDSAKNQGLLERFMEVLGVEQ